jgi:hypothetical protein
VAVVRALWVLWMTMVPYVPRHDGTSRETGTPPPPPPATLPPSRLIRAARRYRAPRPSGAAVITFRSRGVCPTPPPPPVCGMAVRRAADKSTIRGRVARCTRFAPASARTRGTTWPMYALCSRQTSPSPSPRGSPHRCANAKSCGTRRFSDRPRTTGSANPRVHENAAAARRGTNLPSAIDAR